MRSWLFIAGGGALGSVARHGVSRFLHERSASGFPWGTLAVNLSGAFLLGVLAGALSDRVDPTVRLGLMVGVLGGYTTFSTWAVDSVDLLQSGNPGGALANILVPVVAGLAAAAGGLALGRSIA